MHIILKNGEKCLVNRGDFEELNQYKWYLLKGYPARVENKRIIYLHRIVNNTPQGMFTDHINRDKLDNRRSNLRSVGNSLSQYNQNKRKGKSGVRGVHFHMGRWRALIGVNRKQIYLGHYDTIEEATKARTEAEKQYY